jgi:hypothetical protein
MNKRASALLGGMKLRDSEKINLRYSVHKGYIDYCTFNVLKSVDTRAYLLRNVDEFYIGEKEKYDNNTLFIGYTINVSKTNISKDLKMEFKYQCLDKNLLIFLCAHERDFGFNSWDKLTVGALNMFDPYMLEIIFDE